MVGTTDVNVSFELAFGHAVSVLVDLVKQKKGQVNFEAPTFLYFEYIQ